MISGILTGQNFSMPAGSVMSEDKSNYMTFSEYTRNLYQEEDLTEEMVDEEVRGRSL